MRVVGNWAKPMDGEDIYFLMSKFYYNHSKVLASHVIGLIMLLPERCCMSTLTVIDLLGNGLRIWHMVMENINTQTQDLMWENGNMICHMD